jgi:hypothetical protein
VLDKLIYWKLRVINRQTKYMWNKYACLN